LIVVVIVIVVIQSGAGRIVCRAGVFPMKCPNRPCATVVVVVIVAAAARLTWREMTSQAESDRVWNDD
jgi:hypothetical protein